MDKKEKKEQKVKKVKKSAGKLRGFVGVAIAFVLMAGVYMCDMISTGRDPFSFATTGDIFDRFDEEKAEESKNETAKFFLQASNLYAQDSEQQYTSYTLNYQTNVALSPEYNDWTYTNAWRDVTAAVDKNYTVCTVSERYAEGLTYRREVVEYVICKTGSNAGQSWIRRGYADQAVSDVDILEKAAWTQVSGMQINEMSVVAEMLDSAVFGDYDFLEGEFAFTSVIHETVGCGTLKSGVEPKITFSYDAKGERKERAYHEWVCSSINATKAIVPQSLLDIIGDAV
ncbi:MAG: hypothetical protein IJY11_01610 [Clostridia bacterium]|nr:hypothetical protein [Clostridia bacterium]